MVPIYEAGEGEGLLYLLMRFVDGTDLRQLLEAEQSVDPERAAQILAQIASALGAAHRRGLVHRDVKPANVLITADEGEDHAYLTDFGVAKALESTGGVTRTGAIVGTPDYMAPERLEDGVGDGRSDIYALGCVLYQTLTGRLPYPRDNAMAKVFAHLNAPVPSRPRSTRSCPRRSTWWSPGPWPSGRRSATSRPAPCDPRCSRRSGTWRAPAGTPRRRAT